MQTTEAKLPAPGTWGYYFSSKPGDSPRHKQPCMVSSLSEGDLILRFKDFRLGYDSVNRGWFKPDPSAEHA
jgi:hypothetical protein